MCVKLYKHSIIITNVSTIKVIIIIVLYLIITLFYIYDALQGYILILYYIACLKLLAIMFVFQTNLI